MQKRVGAMMIEHGGRLPQKSLTRPDIYRSKERTVTSGDNTQVTLKNEVNSVRLVFLHTAYKKRR